MSAKKVLVVDDSAYMRKRISDALIHSGFEVIGDAADGASAIDAALALQPDIITLDNIMPDMEGLDVLNILKEKKVKAKIIMISSVGLPSAIEEAHARGAFDYLIKPFTDEEIAHLLRKL